jgi:hypothetical protein
MAAISCFPEENSGYIDSVVMTLTLALNKIGENQLIFQPV